ncbi:MAG: hypothetical protein Q9207_006624 [Kuettlingeria erythrocarpa]
MSIVIPPANKQQDAFDLYHQTQESHKSKNVLRGPALPALGHAIAGSTGAAISNVLTYPLALIVTRLQIQRTLRKSPSAPADDDDGYRSIQDAARQIYEHEGGAAGFYAGIGSDVVKTVADSFLFFLAYNFLRQARLRRARGDGGKYLPWAEELGVGFLAGAFSKFWTTPIANVVTRQQAASMMARTASQRGENSRGASVKAVASRIRAEKGLRGFWSGYSASLVLTLNPSLTFFLFETLKRLFVPRSKRSDPPAQVTFFIAAISKAVASTITYPFSLAKAQAQSSSQAVDEEDTEGRGTSEKVQKETDSTSKKPRAKAPTNVFSTILHIARTEGLGALYEGLAGDVLKGFFSHGFTMILKQAVHRLIIQLYYTILRLLRRFPGPESAVEGAKEKAEQALSAIERTVQTSSTGLSGA